MILFIFLSSGNAFSADGLGRLFLTPDQRAQLEVARVQRDRRQSITTEGNPTTPVVPQGPDIVTYDGVVRRSDGKSTVWINGKAVNEQNRMRNGSDVNVLGMGRDGAVSIAVPQADRTASLKVGQSLDVTSGRIEESYARRAMPLRPRENTAPPAVTPVPAVTSSATGSTRPTRPVRESYFKESDPESGAAPMERRDR